jgi:hypothetical protein
MENRPKIFVSSTIIDFNDLRGALKYYLEEFGYEVQMSEYPNFNVDHDKQSFDACLENIKNCKYFILIIGYRRGSWYVPDKISITHSEYLKAKELIEAGHPIRIIAFVRNEIFLLKDDRNALLTHFQDYNTDFIQGILTQGKSLIDDPDYIYNFIQEINDGINLPSETNPVNNWIYQFKEFKDIVVTLKSALNISTSLSDKRFIKLLTDELLECKKLFLKVKPTDENIDRVSKGRLNEVEYHNFYASLKNVCFHILYPNGKFQVIIYPLILSHDDFFKVLQFSWLQPLSTGLPYHLTYPILEKAKNDGTFLNYDLSISEFKNTNLSNGIKDLYLELLSLNKLFESEMYIKFDSFMKTSAGDGTLKLQTVTIDPIISGVLSLLCRHATIPNLIDAIIEAIEHNNDLPLINWKLNNLEEELQLHRDN